MKIIFVDAENVGFKALQAIEVDIIDKVFVFSRVEVIQRYCLQHLFLYLPDYPQGANQADFYIIAYLSRVLACLSKDDKQFVEFVLYSNDVNLINAFNSQCAIDAAKSHIVNSKHDTPPIINKPVATKLPAPITNKPVATKLTPAERIEKQIFKMLKKPQKLSAVQQTLNLSQPLFNKAVSGLLSANKIKRCSESRKSWVQA